MESLLRERLGALTLEQKVHLLTGADFWALHAEPAVGLRRVVTSDGPAGVRGERWDERDPSANVPSPTALAASWDEARVERIGRLLADEARRKGVHVFLAPTVNLHRSPYGGRHFECFSEDPLLTARIGVAYVRGVQAGGVAATVKHFVANDSETERFTLDAQVDERALRELYLAPFEAIVRNGGAWAVMAAYNSVNGTTMTEHPMLRDVLKAEWGFDGIVMSDWYAARSTESAGNGALDLAMPGPTGPWGERLVAAVRDGRVSESAVDDKVLRLLRLAARVGALDGIAPNRPEGPARLAESAGPGAARPEESAGPDGLACAISAELRAAAAAGFVLARNPRGLLPLDRSGLRRVAVLGPNAAVARTLGGGSATVFPPYTVSPLEGLREALDNDVVVTYSAGVRSSVRVPPAPLELLRHPETGAPGVAVRFLSTDGAVLGEEDRLGATWNWLGMFTPELSVQSVAAVEVRTSLHAAESGAYLVGPSGVGAFSLTVRGEVVFDGSLELPAGADPVEGLMRPPQELVTVVLRAGEDTPIVLRYRIQPTGTFGDVAVAGVSFQLNAGPQTSGDDEFGRAVAAAADADLAVVVVGTTEEVESEGFDRESLALPGRQDELVRRVAAVNPSTIVVVNAGAPVLLPWLDEVAAVLLCWFPGQEFGHALADVLLGAAEPGGRLPVVWPSEGGLADGGPIPYTQPVDGVLPYDESIHIGQRGWDWVGIAPALPFGHGLGYTAWEYQHAERDRLADDRTGPVRVRVRLRNTGERRGREVIQVYASRPASAIARPIRWLAGFIGVEADAGAEVVAEVPIAARSFQHWDTVGGTWSTEPGTFVLQIGRSAGDLPLSVAVERD